MLDVVIKGGSVVDGAGAPPRTADVAIAGGAIVEIGRVTDDAAATIDADGLIVAPGFVDVHTHFDAQVFWDTTLSPSPLHGVTTVVGGNCGFTIAPLRPEHGEYLMEMLARVEGMPLASLREGVPWSWTTFASYLDAIDGTLSVNAGFLVGHSAIRRIVMGDAASQREATADELDRMKALLAESLAAGGLGFSSSWAATHNDGEGDPVPSRHATAEEIVELCRVTGEHPGTQLEFIPMVGALEDWAVELMADMSVAADRPLNWNVLFVNAAGRDTVAHQLAASDRAREKGGEVLALTAPGTPSPRLCFASGFLLDTIHGWQKPMTMTPDAKRSMLASPSGRAELLALAAEGAGVGFGLTNWGQYVIRDCIAPELRRYEGRTVADIAAEEGKEPFDALCDIVVADDLLTGFGFPDRETEADWDARVEVWRDDRAIVGASDAGAHLDFLDTFNYSTTLLANAVRKRPLVPVEEAVRLLTDVPARLYGLRGRGRLARGWRADVTVFDPATVDPGKVEARVDLPGGAFRLYSEAEGVHHVLVNGVEIARGGVFTDARPGTVLRSGRDTETVTPASRRASP
jgi:N-acyl-D-aspartate/D-glutamate deacylase